jgi:DNA ligase (NAD+)
MPRVQQPAPVYPSIAWQIQFMDKLITDIVRWKESYYNSGQTDVDDATYDLWWRNLLAMEAKYPQLKRGDSPSTTVGTAPAVQENP